ncbi:lysosomal alpha-glucosidase-like [Amblyomma americanum]
MKLLVALNGSDEAVGDLYWDGGETLDAQLLGEYVSLKFRAANNSLEICSYQYKKLFNSTLRELAIMSVRALGICWRPTRVEQDGYYHISHRQCRWHHSNKVMDLKQILMPLRKNTTVRWFMS